MSAPQTVYPPQNSPSIVNVRGLASISIRTAAAVAAIASVFSVVVA